MAEEEEEEANELIQKSRAMREEIALLIEGEDAQPTFNALIWLAALGKASLGMSKETLLGFVSSAYDHIHTCDNCLKDRSC